MESLTSVEKKLMKYEFKRYDDNIELMDLVKSSNILSWRFGDFSSKHQMEIKESIKFVAFQKKDCKSGHLFFELNDAKDHLKKENLERSHPYLYIWNEKSQQQYFDNLYGLFVFLSTDGTGCISFHSHQTFVKQ